MSTQDIKVWLSIARTSSSKGPDTVHITFRDEASTIEFAEVRLTLEQFAQAVTGVMVSGVDGTVRALDKVGLKMEHKVEEVPFNCWDLDRSPARAAAALKPFEVDGWKGQEEDLFNSHRRGAGREGQVQRVTFRRWLP